MYTLKVSHGYVDEPETEIVKIMGTYETLDEACSAAESKFSDIMDDLAGDCERCFGEVEGGCGDYYVTYGAYDCELGRVFAGYNHYYKVSVMTR